MPATMPTLGRGWVGVWDFHIFPGVMSIAAGAPSQLNPGEVRSFGVPMIVRQIPHGAVGLGYDVAVKVDPQNLILESNEDDNVNQHFFGSKTLCQ
jgi:CARDB protein